MNNQYVNYLNIFFEKLIYYRHISGRTSEILKKDLQDYNSEKAYIHFASALIISDWTSPTDNGWEINFHTGIFTETKNENYKSEIKKITSKHLCFLYAQSFESFERFVKDCIYNRSTRDNAVKEYILKLLPNQDSANFTRERMPSGDKLLKVLKKAGGKSFTFHSSNNNLNIKFKELWSTLADVRHSITHNESTIEYSIISRSKEHLKIFNYLFNSSNISVNSVLIELDYQKFEILIKRFAEFAYQIFKLLSIEENTLWQFKI